MDKSIMEKVAAVTPSARQLAWQETAFYGLVHFGMNTFTDSEWGSGGESPELYTPTKLSVRQWVRVAKGAGMHGLVLNVKHYDGFCLWHTQQTEHSVQYSPCPTDIVREAAEQCEKEGLKFGICISMWDRHDVRYGTEAFEPFFTAQLRELLTGYGELFCVWLDNTCGEGKKGRVQRFDMDKIYALIRELQPNAVICGYGPDVRFSGNYIGFCRKSEWSTVPYYYAPYSVQAGDVKPPRKYSLTDLEPGNIKMYKKGHRAIWYPAEVSMPMRKGWFWHESEKYEVKPLSKIVDTWYAAVGGNACFMLGISPDREGRISSQDTETLLSVGAQLEIDFTEDLAQESAMTCSGCLDTDTGAENVLLPDGYWHSGTAEPSYIEIDLLDDYDINKIVLREAVSLGQRIEAFTVYAKTDGKWKAMCNGTTMGYQWIGRFPETRMQHIRIVIEKTRGFAAIAGLEAY